MTTQRWRGPGNKMINSRTLVFVSFLVLTSAAFAQSTNEYGPPPAANPHSVGTTKTTGPAYILEADGKVVVAFGNEGQVVQQSLRSAEISSLMTRGRLYFYSPSTIRFSAEKGHESQLELFMKYWATKGTIKFVPAKPLDKPSANL